MYAPLLHVAPDVLLYAGSGVRVEGTGFLNPPGELRVGFVLLLETPL